MRGPRNQGTRGPAPGSGAEQPNFPAPIPAHQGPREVLQQQSGKAESGRSISTERRSPRTFAVPVGNSIPHLDPRDPAKGSLRSALTATDTKPSRGIPMAFPEFLQSSAKLPLSIRITGEKIFLLVSICPKNLRESKIEGKALPSRKAPNSGREENPSLPISTKYKNTLPMGISHSLLGEVRATREYQEFCTNPGGSPSWMR